MPDTQSDATSLHDALAGLAEIRPDWVRRADGHDEPNALGFYIHLTPDREVKGWRVAAVNGGVLLEGLLALAREEGRNVHSIHYAYERTYTAVSDLDGNFPTGSMPTEDDFHEANGPDAPTTALALALVASLSHEPIT